MDIETLRRKIARKLHVKDGTVRNMTTGVSRGDPKQLSFL